MATFVERWFDEEPLSILPRLTRPGVRELLQKAAALNCRLGVLSDYPAERKLRAMGLWDYFDIAVAAQDEEVQCFKPNPRGLRVALRRLRLEPAEALYVGDRAEVDAAAAHQIGMRCVIIGRGRTPTGARWIGARDFHELAEILFSS